uniref:Retinoblastoma-associated protein A-box domain-containing protein n=1 Tax=Trichuris muris TaxID=70415 RepID=A0A5S6Q5M0_TRIMR
MTETEDRPEFSALKEQFLTVCRELELSPAKADIAWRGFQAVRRQCLIDTQPMKWLACSVYVACWLCPHMSPTPCEKALPTEIVRSFKIPLLRFFSNLRKWVEMANMSSRCQILVNFPPSTSLLEEKFLFFPVSKMENSFAVSTVLYDRFEFLFNKVFAEQKRKNRSFRPRRRTKKIRVSSGSNDFNMDTLKSFSWILYCAIRKNAIGTSDNLILGYSFLLCMFDTVIHNLADSDRKHLLDQAICEMLRDMDFIHSFSKYCGVSVLDVKFTRAEWWTPRLKALMEDRVLAGNPASLLGLLDQDNFSENLTSINDMYVQLLLRRGDLDERIFLNQAVRKQILPEMKTGYETAESGVDDLDSTDEEFSDRVKENNCPGLDNVTLTPLTLKYANESPTLRAFGTSIVAASRSTNPEIIRQSTNVSNVDSLNYFLQITFTQVAPNPLTYIFDTTKRLGDLYVTEVVKNDDESTYENIEKSTAQLHRTYIDALFVRLLTKLVRFERARCSLLELTESVVQDEFVRSLYGTCVEVVHFSYNPTRLFPWALEHVIKLSAFSYFKMIEIIIKIEPEFSREMIKQLNRIEERVLEELAWVEGSVFWLYKEGFLIPSALEINLATPRITHYYRPKRGQIPVFTHKDGPSQRFSVNQASAPKTACRRLNLDNVSSCIRLNTTCQSKANADSVIKISSISLPRGKFISKSPVKFEAATTSGTNALVLSKKSSDGTTKGRTIMVLGSVTRSIMTLFIKKVYHLAAVRLNHLCERFHASEPVKLQTWALFERIVMKHTEVFKGRHVDQIIICSLFLTTKMMRREVSFRDILYFYRLQPQAHSYIYRRVLMDPVGTKGAEEEVDSDAVEHPLEKVYGDITRFYNNIFCTLVEDDVKAMFTPETDKHGNTPSSPIPSLKTCGSFRKAISKGIYLSPLKLVASPGGTIRPIRYCVERSPVKDLRAINSVIETTADRINERTVSTHVGLARVPSCRRVLFGSYRGTPQSSPHQQVQKKVHQLNLGTKQ